MTNEAQLDILSNSLLTIEAFAHTKGAGQHVWEAFINAKQALHIIGNEVALTEPVFCSSCDKEINTSCGYDGCCPTREPVSVSLEACALAARKAFADTQGENPDNYDEKAALRKQKPS